MITKKQYIEYLLSTPINYTCSNLSEHLENVSHDVVTDFLHINDILIQYSTLDKKKDFRQN